MPKVRLYNTFLGGLRQSNLTSAISDFSKLQHLASYVSCHNAMAYDT
jgi:hypothetical protein